MIFMMHDALRPNPDIDESAAVDLSEEVGPSDESRERPVVEDRLDGEEAVDHDVEAAQRPIPVCTPCTPSLASCEETLGTHQ